jgi:D-alanine-D-alanine ligase-like ATP-grasp enzyme
LELGVKVKNYSQEPSLYEFSYAGKIIFVKKGTVPLIKRMGKFTHEKNITKLILKRFGIKTSNGIIATSLKEALTLIKKAGLKYPLIVKPSDGSLAKGITWDIKSESGLKNAVDFFDKSDGVHTSKRFLVEEMELGNEYRILVLNGKIASCVNKIPAGVTGDGKSTIQELINTFNTTRRKGFEIKLDSKTKKVISQNKLTLKSILPKNFFLKLRNNLNMSDGGRSVECTNQMSAYFKDISLRAVNAIGSGYGGIDLITKDISKSKCSYSILEINSNPYYNMHEKPLVEGVGVDISAQILKGLFPDLKI